MVAGVWSNPRGWRAYADGVALALGVNVWISVVVLPGLFVGALSSTSGGIVSLIPLLALVVSLWRRSEVGLLLAFPSALLLPVALAPEIVQSHVYGPVRFVVVALGLVAYLLGVSFFSSWYEPPPPESVRPLASSQKPLPERWRRRFRVYRYLIGLSVVFPIALIYSVNFDAENTAFLREMYPGRLAAMTAVLNLGAIGLWLVVYALVILGILRPHRTGDRDLITELARARADSRRGRPRPAFYAGVAFALVFMALLLVTRYM